MSHEFMGMEEDRLIQEAPRAFDRQAAVERLSLQYQTILAVLNAQGATEESFLRTRPLLEKIAEEGAKYGVSFERNPTLKWRFTKPAPETGWLVETQMSDKTIWARTNCSYVADASQALRFARKQDAEQFIATCVSPGSAPSLTATEHTWL